MKRTLILLTALFIYSSADCQNFPWSDVSEGTISNKSRQFTSDARPQTYRLVSLEEQELIALLERAPMRNQVAKNQKPTLLGLPMPDGANQEFKVFEAPVMHEDLQRKYPNIKSYVGYGIDDPTAYARFGISSSGFHGMILSGRHSTVYMDVYQKGDTKYYMSFFKEDNHKKERSTFHCGTTDDFSVPELDTQLASRGGDCSIRTYRLALACTGEYGQFHGGTKALVLEEYNRAMTRINGIYEREFSVTMELIPNVDEIIFLNASTDPYTNNNASRMLNENQTTCDNIIGSANYDIGHVFSTADGGIASLRSVCDNGDKARGVTGLPNPTGDGFWVDYVCHEMGHQFGANHTQNNNCARVGSASMEPGSGSTIMSYAGICNPNVQNQVDDYFHARSHIEIYGFIQGAGGTCPIIAQSPNANPFDVGAGSDKTLPISTPFVLEAAADDSGSSTLTYLWDQMDSEFALMPPRATNSEGPAFRSINPSPEPRRYFPNINDLVNNITPTWEVLPSVSREMNFRLVVRDNEPGNGCVNEDDILLTFSDEAGPFLVQQPNGGEEWMVTETQTVNWDVANTNAAPVSCANVDIYLSKDGGLTYPILLSENVPNDGSHDITVPSELTTTARIMVKCADNYFFDISNENFEIALPPEPTFVFNVASPNVSICGNNDAVYDMQIQTLVGFNESVDFSIDGLPQGANASFSSNPMTPPGALTVTITNLSNVSSGTYNLQLNGTSLSKTITTNLVLEVFNGMPDVAALDAPADGAAAVNLNAPLSWDAQTNAFEYLVEVATTAAFGSTTILNQTVTTNTLNLSGLSPNAIYYWRVTAKNICGDAPISDIFAFRTVNPQCFTYVGTNVPITIGNSPGNYTSQLMIPDAVNIISTQVVVDFEHTYIGDLSASITSPDGKTVDLFDRIGVPADNFGCSGNNIRVVFDDDAGNTDLDLENGCNSATGDYTINGIYQPIGRLADFNNDDAQGMWTLNFSDAADDDAGSLREFEIEICKSIVAPPVPQLMVNQVLTITQNQTENITNAYLQAMSQGDTPADLVYQIRMTTSEGNLLLNGTPLAIGDSFTQADINAGRLSYQHTGSLNMTDNFTFDVFNSDDGWLVNQTFNININFNTLDVTASVVKNILCFGDNDGEISINPSGGTAPFEYRLNNGTYQSNSIFTQLTPGTYTPYVRDANGFEAQGADLVITQPNQIIVSATSSGDVITVTASGGTGALMYSKDGTNFQASNTFGGNPNGGYTITVRDANDCIATDNVLVSVNTLVVSFTLVKDITCTGDRDGSAKVDVAGGTPPYEYSFNGLPFQANNVVENLSPGSHTANVRDAAGFQMMTNSVIITDPEPISISTSVNGDNVIVNASGGTGTLRYEIDGLGFQTNNMFSGLANGMHTIVVRDANDCTATDMVQVLVNRIQVLLEVEKQIVCFGDNDGCVIATATGGKEPYQYSLSGGGFQADNRFCGLPPGSYTIVVRDADGLIQTSNTVTITQPSPLTGNANTNGYDIIVNAGGGTPPLTYSLEGIDFQASNIFRDNTPGLYDQITIKDANDCTILVSANLSIDALVLTQMISKEINCAGENTGEVILTPAGGVAPYEFSQDGTNYQDSNIFENLGAGDYTFYVRDDGDFTATVMVRITEPDAININGHTYANKAITINATGGTGALEYNFGTGSFSPSNTLSNVTPGTTINVIVRDENGCTQMLGFNVPEVVFNRAEIQNIDCSGVMGARIQIFADGGVPPLEYSLNGSAFQTQTLFTDVSAGANLVDIRDAGGFEYTFSLPIIPAYPVGGSVMVDGNDITVTASNGQQPFQYSLDGTNFQNSNVFENVPNGSTVITIRDSNGCEATVNADVSGADDLRFKLLFDVSPNPSYGLINLRISQPTLQDLTIRVFDTSGKIVFKTPIRKSGMVYSQSFNLNHLPSGSYLFTISDGQKIGRKRLVLMK